ncbi:MAG: hypothetical protein ACFCUJ_02720 [Thiotrichales bacterium]
MSEPKSLDRAPRWRTPLVTLLIIAAVGILVWSQLPKGAYPTDLNLIGDGRPALVLAYDINYAGGMQVMELMNAIRAEYADRAQFIVAHLGTPDGQAFADRHRIGDGTVMMFAGDGAHVETSHLPRTHDELRGVIDSALR